MLGRASEPLRLSLSSAFFSAGVYQCFARNSFSTASAWGVLNVTGAEVAAPESLRCWPTGASDVVLKWTKVPHDVIAYTVQTTMPGNLSY